jgi:hypothetical protein
VLHLDIFEARQTLVQGELETAALAGMRCELLAVALEMQKDGV